MNITIWDWARAKRTMGCRAAAWLFAAVVSMCIVCGCAGRQTYADALIGRQAVPDVQEWLTEPHYEVFPTEWIPVLPVDEAQADAAIVRLSQDAFIELSAEEACRLVDPAEEGACREELASGERRAFLVRSIHAQDRYGVRAEVDSDDFLIVTFGVLGDDAYQPLVKRPVLIVVPAHLTFHRFCLRISLIL